MIFVFSKNRPYKDITKTKQHGNKIRKNRAYCKAKNA